MESLIDNQIKGVPVIQNKQEFIIGVFKISQILKFTRYTERLIVGYSDDNKPIYNNQIQRKVESHRVEKIADFLIEDPEATFPTNIVLSIPAQVIEAQTTIGDFLVIELNNRVFSEVSNTTGDVFITIIDGQHRIRGIEIAIKRLEEQIDSLAKTLRRNENQILTTKLDYYKGRLTDLLSIELLVTFFIDKTLEFQAMIFSTINRTQKKVSQNLVYSLFGLTSEDSPQKTALEIVLSLNSHKNSPFWDRIKLYGGEYLKGQSPPLSQATMVKAIIDLICENPRDAELDRFKKRRDLLSNKSGKFLPFRIFYANNNDEQISNAIYYFFKSVEINLKDPAGISYWTFVPNSKPTNILHTTVGFEALLKILVDIFSHNTWSRDIKFSLDLFKVYIDKLTDIDFTNQQTYPFSTKGKNILYLTMNLKLWPAAIGKNDERIVQLKILNNDE